MEAPSIFEAMFGQLTFLRQHYQCTHMGTTPAKNGTLLWGLRHPDPTLYLFRWDGGDAEIMLRDRWEKLTTMNPPFPWNKAGDGMVYPDAAEPVSTP